MDEKTLDVARKAVEFLKAAGALESGGGALDSVDTSVFRLGEMKPVLTEERLAVLEGKLRDEALAADVANLLITAARMTALSLLAL